MVGVAPKPVPEDKRTAQEEPDAASAAASDSPKDGAEAQDKSETKPKEAVEGNGVAQTAAPDTSNLPESNEDAAQIAAPRLTNAIATEIARNAIPAMAENDRVQATKFFIDFKAPQHSVPFTFLKGERIPSLFKFVSYHSDMLTGSTTSLLHNAEGVFSPSAPPMFAESRELMKPGTYAVRLEPVSQVSDALAAETLNLFPTVLTYQTERDMRPVQYAVSAMIAAFTAYVAQPKEIMTFQHKYSLYGKTGSHLHIADVSRVLVGDNAHPYLGDAEALPWLTDLLNELSHRAPLVLGERNATSVSGVKMIAESSVVTDYHTASRLTRNCDYALNHRVKSERYRRQILAHSPHGTTAIITSAVDSAWRVAIDVDDLIYTAGAYRLVASSRCLLGEQGTLLPMLQSSGVIALDSSANVISYISALFPDGHQTMNEFVRVIGVCSEEELYRRFLIEMAPRVYNCTWLVSPSITFLGRWMFLLQAGMEMAMFPKTFQAYGYDYAYHIMDAFRSMDHDSYNALLDRFGAISRRSPDGVWTAYERALRPISEDEARQGCVYSLFRPDVQQTRLPECWKRYSAIFTVACPATHLGRKQAAEMPYAYQDYVAYRSYPVDLTVESSEKHNGVSHRVTEVVAACHKIFDKCQVGPGTIKEVAARDIGVIRRVISEIAEIARGSAGVARALAQLEDLYQNTYLHVAPQYNTAHPLIPMPEYGLGSGAQGVYVRPVTSLRVMSSIRPIGLNVALTGSGRFIRPQPQARQQGSYTMADTIKERTRVWPDSVQLVAAMRRFNGGNVQFARAMATTQYLFSVLQRAEDENGPVDPRAAFPAALRDWLSATSAGSIIEYVSRTFSVDLGDIYCQNFFGTVGDMRSSSLTLFRIDPLTGLPLRENASIFNREITWQTADTAADIQDATYLFLSMAGPMNSYSKGYLVHLALTTVADPNGERPQAVHERPYAPELFTQQSDDYQRSVAYVTEEGQLITDPESVALEGVRLVVDSMASIAMFCRDFILKSICARRMSVLVKEDYFSYDIKYVLDPHGGDCDRASAEALATVAMSLKEGSLPKFEFADSRFALLQTSFSTTKPGRYVAIHPLENVQTREVFTGLYDESARPGTSRNDNGDAFGRGRDGNITPVGLVPKATAQPNMNNDIRLLSEKVQTESLPDVEVRLQRTM